MFFVFVFLFFVFFASVLTDGLSLESDGLQVSSNLQDSPHYSSLSQQCHDLDGLHYSSDFHFIHPQLIIWLSGNIQVFISLLAFFHFHSVIRRWNNKIHWLTSYFLLSNSLGLLVNSLGFLISSLGFLVDPRGFLVNSLGLLVNSQRLLGNSQGLPVNSLGFLVNSLGILVNSLGFLVNSQSK